MKLIKMVLYFENLDSVAINGEYVAFLSLKGIGDAIFKGEYENVIRRNKIVKSISFMVNTKANTWCKECSDKIFPRIIYGKDIVSVDLHIEENGNINIESYDIEWKNDSEHENNTQDAFMDTEKDLYVKIGDESIEEIFKVKRPDYEQECLILSQC